MGNPLAQWLATAERREGLGFPLRARRALRRRVVSHWDPLVRYPWHGRELLLPLSHGLPTYRRTHPTYDEPLARIVSALAQREPQLRVVDVGANVGDTAVLVLDSGARAVLCVEGESRYLHLLQRNTRELDGVVIEPRYVGSGQKAVAAVAGAGTARLEPDDGGVPLTPLDEIIERNPQFSEAHMLKVDTDGWDVEVLRSARGWLATRRPAVFFEHDAHLAARAGHDIAECWPLLRSCGYTAWLAWRNVGTVLDAGEVGSEVPESVRMAAPYVDVLAVDASREWLVDLLGSG